MAFPVYQVFAILVSVGVSQAVDFPLPTCVLNTPNYNKCLKEAAETSIQKIVKGIPGFEFPSFEPFALGDHEVEAKVTGVVGSITFHNALLGGATKLHIDSAKLKDGKIIVLDGSYKELTLSSDDVHMKGKLLTKSVEVKHAKLLLTLSKDVSVHVEVRFNSPRGKKGFRTLVQSAEIFATLKNVGDIKFVVSAPGAEKAMGEKLNSMLSYGPVKKTVFKAFKSQIEKWIGEKVTEVFEPFLKSFSFGAMFPKA